LIIGHRGASAYAPENTLPSYELAVRQGADCIELDLHATKDRVLVCIHDLSLERTTNVRDRFPKRRREVTEDGARVYRWFVYDFTLAELKTLDCGAWFAPDYAGATIQTFEEVLDWARTRTAVLAELKYPEAYAPLGIDLLSLFDAAVRRHSAPDSHRNDTPLTVQSFHEPTVVRAGSLYQRRLPVVFLRQATEAIQCANRERLAAIAAFATGLGPEKSSLEARPQLVELAHQAGLQVTPWTFRASSPGRFKSVHDEMAYYLSELNVDAVITDNPDQALR
jgi:glycerophosphoryl diester phosphodiesterase